MDTLIEDCGECPLERICNEDECTHVWERFLEAKVKEDGVEIEEQKSYEVDHAQNYNKTLEHDADIIRKQINAGWIPVEERLPEDDVDVLVTYADIDDEEYADITTTTYGNAYLGGNKLDFKEWRSPFEYFKSNYKVTAWQYLPEPYRPERNSEE